VVPLAVAEETACTEAKRIEIEVETRVERAEEKGIWKRMVSQYAQLE
jgi:hypothetical protein